VTTARTTHTAIKELDALIDFAGSQEALRCFSPDKGGCMRRVDPEWGRALTTKEYQSMCAACRCYYHLSAARNDLYEHARIR